MPNTVEDAVLKKNLQRGGTIDLTVEFIGPTALTEITFLVNDHLGAELLRVDKNLTELQTVTGNKMRYSFKLQPGERFLLRNGNKFLVTSLTPAPKVFNAADWTEVDMHQAFPKGVMGTWWEKAKNFLRQRTNNISFNWKWAVGIAIAIMLLIGMVAAGLSGYQVYKHWPAIKQKIATFRAQPVLVNKDADLPPPALDLPATETNQVVSPPPIPTSEVAKKAPQKGDGNNISNSGQMGNVKQVINYIGSQAGRKVKGPKRWTDDQPNKVWNLPQTTPGTVSMVFPPNDDIAVPAPAKCSMHASRESGMDFKNAWNLGSPEDPNWVDQNELSQEPQENGKWPDGTGFRIKTSGFPVVVSFEIRPAD